MLKPISAFKVQPLLNNVIYDASFDGSLCEVQSTQGKFSAAVEASGATVRLSVKNFVSEISLAVAIDLFFGHFQELDEALIVLPQNAELKELAWFVTDTNELKITREAFLQLPLLWHRSGEYKPSPEVWTETQGRKHPTRAKLVEGVFYRRYIPRIGKTLSFRTVQIEKDLDLFHEWHNNPRVSALWELNQPKEELRQYLEKGLADDHQIPMIMELDGDSVGYFELYWAAEDRIGPYYEYSPFDRGFHFLIGNDKYLGLENTDSALRSVAHMIFLEDARTRFIVAEPRADNKRVLRYIEIVPGWKFVKEFDFPHKRAALIQCTREHYFAGRPL